MKKKTINQLSPQIKAYTKEKSKIEKFLKNSKIRFIILRLNNLVGKNDHSKKTNFIFNLNLRI